jgi:threonine synthase
MDAIRGAGYSTGRSSDTLIRELSEESGLEIPVSIATLGEKEIRHKDVIAKEEMENKVREILIG